MEIKNKLTTFFDPQQSLTVDSSFSISSSKPALLIDHLKNLNINIDVVEFAPCTLAELKCTHDPLFIDDLFAGLVPNGFGTYDKFVANGALWTCGSIKAAALYSFQSKNNSFSPTSGFHHAHYYEACGFCTVNGLVVAAQACLQSGAERIGILDLDTHLGNGTEDIIEKLALDDYIIHYTFGRDRVTAVTAEHWLNSLGLILDQFRGCQIIIYQAGADPYINDPLGGVLTKQQLRIRDKIVFSKFKALGIPVCWNLAGGYTDPFSEVLDIHTNTVLECLKVQNNFEENSAFL